MFQGRYASTRAKMFVSGFSFCTWAPLPGSVRPYCAAIVENWLIADWSIGDRGFVDSLLGEFPGEIAALLGHIRDAAPLDREAIRRHAHSLKSSAANLGATALVASASRLESAADSTPDVSPHIAELEAVAATTVAALEALDAW